MDDTDPIEAGHATPTDAELDWASRFLHLDLRAARGAGKPSGGIGKPVLDRMLDAAQASVGATPNATATALFFDYDKAKLTGSDQASLDAYIKAYLDARSTELVTVDGFASIEGNEVHNEQLALNRANAVADYLLKHGIPKGKVKPVGHKPTTDFSPTDLSQNRRATLSPPPPASSGTSPSVQPGGKDPMRMRGDPDLRKDGEDAAKHIIGDKPGTPPDDDVPRSEFEPALKKFLHDLAKSQGHKAVTTTAKVVIAENKLREGMEGRHVVDRPEDKAYDPDDLGKKIADNLPPKIPRKNFKKFQALPASDAPQEGKTIDQIRKKYREERDKIVSKLPKSWQEYAKKGMDAAAEHGVPYVVDEAMKAGGVNSDLEGKLKGVVEDYVKKVIDETGGDDK